MIIAFAVTPLAASTVLAAWVFALGLLFKEPEDEMGALVAIFFAASLFLGYLATMSLACLGTFCSAASAGSLDAIAFSLVPSSVSPRVRCS